MGNAETKFAQADGAGSWALVTGGNTGLGRITVRELMRDGFGVVLDTLA